FIPLLFFCLIPKSKADLSIPLIRLPYPDLTLYYLIEGESILQNVNPLLTLNSRHKSFFSISMLRVSFPDYYNDSKNEYMYELTYFGFSKTVNTTLNELTRITKDGQCCPFYLKYSGISNIIGLEFDWIYEYGGIKYIKWNNFWLKTILYYFNYQDGSTTYAFRFYYDYTSHVLIQLEEETTTNLIQTQYLKYTLFIGNVFLTQQSNFAGEWGQMTNYVIAAIISLVVTIFFGLYLVKKKSKVR
ncbi:MAG: hypothetical protein ACFFDN_08070, partial [Candidatus Hodarchaeota archaeon]